MDRKHFFEGLGERLLVGNGNEGPIFNSKFLGWEKYLGMALARKKGYSCAGDYYRDSEDALEILDICEKHAKRHSKKELPDHVLVMVHPLYLPLSHMDRLSNKKQEKEVEGYLDKFFSLINNPEIDRSRLGFVLLEDLHHYAAATSLLVEQGKFDRVVLTKNDVGYPLDGRDTDFFLDKSPYFIGAYDGSCLAQSISSVRAKTVKRNHIYAVKDMVLRSPLSHEGSLRVNDVDEIDSGRHVTLKRLLSRFSLS